jgi:hypothetical protein
MPKHLLRVALAVMVVVVATALPALASTSTISATPNPVHHGHFVRLHGKATGCPRGDRVTLLSHAFMHRHSFAGVPAVYARVGAGKTYSVRTRIPASRAAGDYTVSGRCGGGNLGVSLTLHVVG